MTLSRTRGRDEAGMHSTPPPSLKGLSCCNVLAKNSAPANLKKRHADCRGGVVALSHEADNPLDLIWKLTTNEIGPELRKRNNPVAWGLMRTKLSLSATMTPIHRDLDDIKSLLSISG